MQASTGNIMFYDEPVTKEQSIEEGLVPLSQQDLQGTVNMTKGQRKNWMRNKPCICGSGTKFKKCCWSKYSFPA